MQIPRMHLIELHELSWMPDFIRNYVTDILSLFWHFDGFGTTLPVLSIAVDALDEALSATKSTELIDLASGAGKAACMATAALREIGHKDLELVLSDIYPNRKAFQKLTEEYTNTSYISESVDATCCTESGFRTFYASFHHFKPETAVKILKDIVDRDEHGIGIFEMTDRSFWNLFILIGTVPLFIFLFTPLIKPFSLKRFLFTYIIPLIPFLLWFDGFVSVLRTYTEQELFEMIKLADPDEKYEWKFERKMYGITKANSIIAYKK